MVAVLMVEGGRHFLIIERPALPIALDVAFFRVVLFVNDFADGLQP